MYCAYCGKPLKENDTFCGYCGKRKVSPSKIKQKKVVYLENNKNPEVSKLLNMFGIILLTLSCLITMVIVLFGSFDIDDFVSNNYINVRKYRDISITGINLSNADRYLDDFGFSTIIDNYKYMKISGNNVLVDTVEGYHYAYDKVATQDIISLGFYEGELVNTDITLVFVGNDTEFTNILNEVENVGSSFDIDNINNNLFEESFNKTYDTYLKNEYYVEGEKVIYSDNDYTYSITVTISNEISNHNGIDEYDLYKININKRVK